MKRTRPHTQAHTRTYIANLFFNWNHFLISRKRKATLKIGGLVFKKIYWGGVSLYNDRIEKTPSQ